MKLMIASDIHGSALYCAQMKEAYKREGAGRLLLLGDILYHGPRNDLPDGYAPKKVIAMLNPMKNEILCVRGNCDTEVDQMVLDFPILADYCYVELEGASIFAAHGHVFHPGHLPPSARGQPCPHFSAGHLPRLTAVQPSRSGSQGPRSHPDIVWRNTASSRMASLSTE